LSWSPVHDSDLFWRENVTKLNDGDYKQLRTLIHLLKESRDTTVLAVAAHDVGQYVKFYDLGKKYAFFTRSLSVTQTAHKTL
jgi:V-type H+-transporting ATPase subunit H